MSRSTRIKITLNPHSEYHRILIKNLGREGAIQALKNCNMAYNMDMGTYHAIANWKPRVVHTKSLAR